MDDVVFVIGYEQELEEKLNDQKFQASLHDKELGWWLLKKQIPSQNMTWVCNIRWKDSYFFGLSACGLGESDGLGELDGLGLGFGLIAGGVLGTVHDCLLRLLLFCLVLWFFWLFFDIVLTSL